MKSEHEISSGDDETARLRELHELCLLNVPREPAFDRITRLGTSIFRTDTCLITLVTEDRQWFKSCAGLHPELEEAGFTSREDSFCQYVVANRCALVVEDALLDPRFVDNRLVREYGIRFYAGVPLQTASGSILGTLCLLDGQPRSFTEEELRQLEEFSCWVITEIELRRDLLSRQQLAEELYLEKQKIELHRDLIQRAFQSSLDGRLLCNQRGEMLLYNKRVLEAFLVNPELHDTVFSFIREVLLRGGGSPEPLLSRIGQLLSGELQQFNERFVIQLQGDEQRYYEVWGTSIGRGPLTDAEPQVLIGFRERSDEERVDAMKNEFISVVSHELRTPLTSIMGFVEILLDRNPELEKRVRYLSTIHKEAERLTQLLNDLLDLQKMESGKQQYVFQPVDMVQLTGEVAEIWQDHVTHRVVFRSDCRELYVLADPDRMKQALHNLISNAVKYSPGQDLVDIHLHHGEGMARLSIRDYGLGIPPDAREKLFTKFYRVDNSDRRKIGGTGLGLVIVREIMLAHGGLVEYTSEPGEGTEFTLQLETMPEDAGMSAPVQTER